MKHTFHDETNATEIIDIYDEKLQKIGRERRDLAEREGHWHRTFHCWIIRPVQRGFVLFQKRGRHKKLYPGLFDITAAGHYRVGERAKDGVREINEELGLPVKLSELIPLGVKIDVSREKGIVNREFCDVFILICKSTPDCFRPDLGEVEGIVQMRIADGLRLFSGERRMVGAKGTIWSHQRDCWENINLKLARNDFVPRVDPYYLKIFIMANLILQQQPYVSI